MSASAFLPFAVFAPRSPQLAAHSVEWKAALLSGYSVLVAGFGSKKALLDLFALSSLRCVVAAHAGAGEVRATIEDAHAHRLLAQCASSRDKDHRANAALLHGSLCLPWYTAVRTTMMADYQEASSHIWVKRGVNWPCSWQARLRLQEPQGSPGAGEAPTETCRSPDFLLAL